MVFSLFCILVTGQWAPLATLLNIVIILHFIHLVALTRRQRKCFSAFESTATWPCDVYTTHQSRRVARIWKRGGFFERVRKEQTTLIRIFILLKSESHGLFENWDGISRKARKFKRFFRPKTGDLQKKKKVFTEIETNFSAKIGYSNAFSGRFTTCTSQLRHPISFGGGAVFNFSPKIGLKSTKNVRFCILHKRMGGGARAPPPPWLRYCTRVVNGATISGPKPRTRSELENISPNPKTSLKLKLCPKKKNNS